MCENVSGLLTKRFADYVDANILRLLAGDYTITAFTLNAADYGVPQRRKRVFFVGFANADEAAPIRAACSYPFDAAFSEWSNENALWARGKLWGYQTSATMSLRLPYEVV